MRCSSALLTFAARSPLMCDHSAASSATSRATARRPLPRPRKRLRAPVAFIRLLGHEHPSRSTYNLSKLSSLLYTSSSPSLSPEAVRITVWSIGGRWNDEKNAMEASSKSQVLGCRRPESALGGKAPATEILSCARHLWEPSTPSRTRSPLSRTARRSRPSLARTRRAVRPAARCCSGSRG